LHAGDATNREEYLDEVGVILSLDEKEARLSDDTQPLGH
jgi:hypothetical protein